MSKVLDYAYAGLLHDIGKFYQRTELNSSLTEYQYSINDDQGNHTYTHADYTSQFMKQYLNINDNIEKAASSHHLDCNDEFCHVIKRADCISSSVDRADEKFDNEKAYIDTNYKYLTSRLNSIFYEVDFGKDKQQTSFPLKPLDQIRRPQKSRIKINEHKAIEEYKELFDKFIQDLEKEQLLKGTPTPFKYHRMYSLLYKYTTFIPTSTYETDSPTVSLFDHLKLTSAIASCLAFSQNEQFYMLEFDISGIQNFIYKITEGSSTKHQVAKSLRGRSAYISLLTNAITYAILDKFSLTEANIIFNTGGGGNILLPYLSDTEERIHKVCQSIQKKLYHRFNTQLTFVYAYEKLDAKELEMFRSEKALSLKVKLDVAKQQKYLHFIDDQFSFEPLEEQPLCQLCHDHYATKDGICNLCQDTINISNYYTNHEQFLVLYDFHNNFADSDLIIDMGFVKLVFIKHINDLLINKTDLYHIDSINCFECGNVKLLGNMVPKNRRFEDIVKMTDREYGDQKLGILKMDVDNLGAIFAFGLKQRNDDAYMLQRSLSKYLTLSRLMEFFFSQRLKDICINLSKRLTKYNNVFYINYAGGDDLVIMGPVYAIIQLAYEIHNEFKQYTNNENITISGGIHIQSSKKPVRFGIQYAEDALELSKNNKDKNSITLFETTVSFDELRKILDIVEKYRKYIKNGQIGRSSFYHIMRYINANSISAYYAAIPLIQYSLYRNISNQNLRLEISKDLTSIRDSMEDLKKLVLMMKLTIMFTREV